LQRLAVRIEYIYDLQWSPDGEWLLFASDYDRGVSIFRVRAEGSRLEYLTSGRNPQYAPIAGMDWHPSWLMTAAIGIIFLSMIGRLRR
jgi:hypothetical protein